MNKDILNESIKHLLKDEKLKALIDKYPIPQFSPNRNYFAALSKSIIYQQLSGRVAKIIYARFQSMFDYEIPTPDEYINMSAPDLRAIGLSKQKISYIENLSKFFIEKDGALKFDTDSDEEIRKQLIAIKGIGQWTIDMFMMFTLCRIDVLPIGDLAIKKAFKELYTLKELPSESFMKKKSLRWRPYRSIASFYLWMLVDDEAAW